MNCLADKISARTTATSRVVFFLIFSIFVIIQSAQAQDQWRVFTTSNSPLPSNTVGSIIIDNNNVKWIGTDNGMVRIEGNNWQVFDTLNTPLGTNGIGPVALDSLNNIWCTLNTKGIAKFDGVVWTIYNTTNSGLPTNNCISISIDRANNKWIGTIAGLSKFDDINWTIYNSTNSGLPSNIVTSVAIENHIKWIGTFSLFGGMAKFNDTNWVIYNSTNSGLPSNAIRYISLDTGNSKWVCMDFGGLAKFNSELNNWTVYNTTNSGLPSNSTVTIKISNDNRKFISAQDEGFIVFNDNTWQIFNINNSPLPSNTVSRIEIDKLNNVWITTANGLAIYNPIGIIAVGKNNNNVPEFFHLHHNYPNPFNPITTIKYELPKDGLISLKIYDILGREIYSINEFKKAGVYDLKFDGSNFASGIYFYRLESGNYVETKKMVLVK